MNSVHLLTEPCALSHSVLLLQSAACSGGSAAGGWCLFTLPALFQANSVVNI